MKLPHSCKRPLYWIVAVSAFVGTACSNDDMPEMPHGTCSVSFEADALPYSRVTTTENITEFKVSAVLRDNSYLMKDVVVTRTGLNRWEYSPEVDWPGTPVTFIAVSPASAPLMVNPFWEDMINFSNDGHTDLLVSKRTVSQTSGSLKLHFHHALAMVNVFLHSDLADDKVRVLSVGTRNISGYGQYLYPKDGTDGLSYERISDGWTIWSQEGSYIGLFSSDNGILIDSAPVPADNRGYFYFLPTELPDMTVDGYVKGAFLEIIYRIEDAYGNIIWPDSSTDPMLVAPENPAYGIARLPLGKGIDAGRWIAGVNYRYSVNLNSPAAIPPSRSTAGNEMTVEISSY